MINTITALNFQNPVTQARESSSSADFGGSIFEGEEAEMNLIAHRGYSAEAPENTIPAVIMAAENGYTTVECDIEWTKDNVPVLLHDETINRTARKENGSKLFFKKKCSNLTYEELLKYDFGAWRGEEFKGTKIPTLYELLDCGKEYGLDLYLEIKETDDFNKEKAEVLANAVKEAGLEEDVTWISFNPKYLKIMSEVMPASRLGYLYDKKPTDETKETLQGLQTGENEVFLDLKYSKMSDSADKLLDEAGFDFEVWTVDDSSALDELYEYGCIGVTTNSITEDEIDF